MSFSTLIQTLLLATLSLTTALSIPRSQSAVQLINPILSTPVDCSTVTTQYATECRTVSQAAPYLITAMSQYNITSAPEIAAVISLIAFETENFLYNIHHFPNPVAGQGTRNMQSVGFNRQYAASIPALAGPLAKLATGDDAGVLNLLLPDEYTWGSGAWFLTSQCTADVRTQLQTGSDAGWEAYLNDCVQTPPTDARRAYWTRAKTSFGI